MMLKVLCMFKNMRGVEMRIASIQAPVQATCSLEDSLDVGRTPSHLQPISKSNQIYTSKFIKPTSKFITMRHGASSIHPCPPRESVQSGPGHTLKLLCIVWDVFGSLIMRAQEWHPPEVSECFYFILIFYCCYR
jgi:hypothetical protein